MRRDALLAGILGAAIGLAGGLALAPRPVSVAAAPAASGPASGGASSDEVVAELRRIRTLLAVQPAVAATEQPPSPAEPADSPPQRASDELVAALRAVEHALRSASASSGTGTPPAGLRASEEGLALPLPARLGALRTARGSLEGPGPQVVPELFGLSPSQVYERFGTPPIVGSSPGRVRWLYEDPDYPGHLVVTFFDGYVGWIHVTTE